LRGWTCCLRNLYAGRTSILWNDRQKAIGHSIRGREVLRELFLKKRLPLSRMLSLYKGDCLEVMAGLPGKSVDCFVCDLPYGCLTGGGGKEKAKRKEAGRADHIAGCAWDIKIDLVEFWKQVKRLCKNDHTPVLMFCSTAFGAELINSNPSWFRYDLIWSKSNAVGFLTANKMPMRSHELIYVFSKKGANYKRIDIEGDFPAGGGGRSTANFLPIAGMPNLGTTEAGRRCVKSVIEIANKKVKGGHPTQKPPELYKWLLERYCPSDGCVLDPTAGSFTSCFTAKEMGLRAIGIEKNTEFFWKAVSKTL
jgi:site-specific DNA-methyltransferase (adenine-specific)